MNRSKWIRRLFVRDFVEGLIAAVVVAVLLRVFFISVYRVPTDTMTPALLPGDFILGFKTAYALKPPSRGDMVVFRSIGDPNLLRIKRVGGLAGDKVVIKAGNLFVNDLEVTPTHGVTDAQTANDYGPVIVPPGQVFLLGETGHIPVQNIESRAVLIWFSINLDESQSAMVAGVSKIRWSRLFSVIE